jgi:hypothetical protein
MVQVEFEFDVPNRRIIRMQEFKRVHFANGAHRVTAVVFNDALLFLRAKGKADKKKESEKAKLDKPLFTFHSVLPFCDKVSVEPGSDNSGTLDCLHTRIRAHTTHTQHTCTHCIVPSSKCLTQFGICYSPLCSIVECHLGIHRATDQDHHRCSNRASQESLWVVLEYMSCTAHCSASNARHRSNITTTATNGSSAAATSELCNEYATKHHKHWRINMTLVATSVA